MKKELPVDKLDERDFNENFKTKHLDKVRLDKKSLEEISKLFELGQSTTARICCDDYHGHSYGCLWYYFPQAGIIERLISEIKEYQDILGEINSKTKISE